MHAGTWACTFLPLSRAIGKVSPAPVQVDLELFLSRLSWGAHAHPLAPLGEEPALGTRSHVAVLNVAGPQLHVALLIGHHIPDVAHTLYVTGPLAHATGHGALKHTSGLWVRRDAWD